MNLPFYKNVFMKVNRSINKYLLTIETQNYFFSIKMNTHFHKKNYNDDKTKNKTYN